MTGDLVDKVAAAIHGVEGIMLPFSAMPEEWKLKQMLRAKARAAIAAMRDPSQGMLNAGCQDLGAGGELDDDNLSDIWRDMIDTALAEQH